MNPGEAAKLQEIIKEEYKKCLESPVYFMRKYCKIQHEIRGTIPFDLFDCQEKTLNDLRGHDYNIILKSRQLGISTLVAGYSLWLILFFRDKKVLCVATSLATAKNMITKVKFMMDGLPVWLRVAPTEDNKLSIRLKNGSQIKALSSSAEAARSESSSLFIWDETAFTDNDKEIWTAAQPTLANGGRCVLLSTPNGVSNLFYELWRKAEDGEAISSVFTFNTIKLPWWLHPDRDQKWRDGVTAKMGERMAAQECDCDFITSGNTVIDGIIIKEYKEKHCKDPLEKRGLTKDFWVWEYPMPGKSYMVAADVARGDGKDSSAFVVLDIETVRVVAEFRAQFPTDAYGNILVEAATMYNDALLVIENDGVGWAVIQQVMQRGYKNLYYTERDIKVLEDTMKSNYGPPGKKVPGFTNSMKTRPLIISKLEEYARTKQVEIYSSRMVGEMFTFIWKNGKAQAAEGYHDDLVLALSIALWVRDTAMRLNQFNLDATKMALKNIAKAAPVDEKIYTSNYRGVDPFKLQVGQGAVEDLKWLIS